MTSYEKAPDSPRPIFVLGSPRSGTSLLGAYLGTHPEVLDLEEFSGFYVTHALLPETYVRVPSPVKKSFLTTLQSSALNFAHRAAADAGCSHFCDSTPWNLLVAHQIERQCDEALFVLMIRRPEGVVDSLERSYRDGYAWAGETISERAELWCQSYSQARFLPHERTIALSYDNLLVSPEETLSFLHAWLDQHSLASTELDLLPFTVSHATNSEDNRRPVARKKEDQSIEFTAWEGAQAHQFNDQDLEVIKAKTESLELELYSRFSLQDREP